MRKLKVDLSRYHRWFIRWSERNITEEDCLNGEIENLYVMLSDWLDLMAIPIDRKLIGQEIVFPVNAEHQDKITYDTFLEGCRIIKGKVTKVTPVQICVNGKFYDYAPYIEGQFTASVDTEKSYSLDEIGDMSFEPGTGRGAEVDKYIKDNNIKQFVIFDDEDWDWTYYGLEEHWCRSTYYDKKYGGLQPGHIKKAIQLLD